MTTLRQGLTRPFIVTIVLAWSPLAMSFDKYSKEKGNYKSYEVTQFGYAEDAKYIFCEEGGCPTRTTKHYPPQKTEVAVIQTPARVLEPEIKKIERIKKVKTKSKPLKKRKSPKRKAKEWCR